ncbi:hypothetical protein HID58_011639, partial [Brassica napus]
FLYSSASLTLCRPDQRDALLEFKSEFELGNPPEFLDELLHDYLVPVNVTSYPKTKSWANNSDCCQWDGITCDANSGMVTGVDLSYSSLHGHFKLNSSLFVLRQLRNLNLAYNDFNASPIPSGFNKLMGLERLNLSHSWFSGQIPPEILHLTKLVSLDLSSCFNLSQSRPLFIDKPFLGQLAQNLTNLRHLDMSYVNISSEIPQMISNLTSLRSICLHKCHLFGRLPLSFLRSPIIQSIDLSMNPYLESSLPEFNGSNSLVYLDLSETSISRDEMDENNPVVDESLMSTAEIPFSIGNLSLLNTLHLSSNNFDGEIPSSIQNLNQMTNVNVLNNMFSGDFLTALLNLTKLTDLALAFNHFTGALSPNITSLSNLKYFDASLNSFVGSIPSTLFTIPSLETIFLNNNQLSGPLEIGNISSMSKLQELDLSRNDLTGPIPRSISKFVNLLLKHLYLSYLNTTTVIDLNKISSSHLESLTTLRLSGNYVSPKNMSSVSILSSQLNRLKMSDCGITRFPKFIRTQQHMISLDLSYNEIKGGVPGWLWKLPKLTYADLSNNMFSGFIQFPKHLSKTQMEVISLSENNFSGEIPISILLSLGSNHLGGKLPDIFLNGSNLRSLNVGRNQLVHKLPRSLSDCSSLEYSSSTLMSFTGRYNTNQRLLLGFLSCESHNAFTGALPSDFFMYWSAMHSEKNHSKLKSRDELHQDPYTLNKLSGQIPHSLAGLTSLSTVRVSHNKLVGMIPQSTQFQTQRVSGFCGAPLDECGVVGHDDPPLEEEEEEQVLSWIAAAIGFAPGVVIGLTIAFPQIALVVRRQ